VKKGVRVRLENSSGIAQRPPPSKNADNEFNHQHAAEKGNSRGKENLRKRVSLTNPEDPPGGEGQEEKSAKRQERGVESGNKYQRKVVSHGPFLFAEGT